MECVELLAERVSNAASTMREAAETMRQAAASIDEPVRRQQRDMEGWLVRFREIVEAARQPNRGSYGCGP